MDADRAAPRRAAGRPRGGDVDATRATILRSARARFAAQGYDATSVRALAADAGVTQPTIYHHFGSKAGLFAAAYRDADRRLIEELTAAAGEGTTLADRLGAMVDALAALHDDDPTIAGMLSVGQLETARTSELAAARRAAGGPAPGPEVPELLRAVVDDAAAAGELPLDADPEGVIALLTAMTLGVAMFSSMIDPGVHAALLVEWRRLVVGDLLSAAGGRGGSESR